uniref:Uncharacterized protein n=1 Tax=Aegilops tauschii subsp. strangulata TaxID=200361 RepID=A0A452Y353_AEGTS
HLIQSAVLIFSEGEGRKRLRVRGEAEDQTLSSSSGRRGRRGARRTKATSSQPRRLEPPAKVIVRFGFQNSHILQSSD